MKSDENELASLPNPFRDSVVLDAWQSPADVPEIHQGAFEACLLGVDAAASGVPDSLLIYGPAGSGKTHLLTRVQRHLAETAQKAPDQALRCVFVYVRLQTAPQLLWQHVRRRLAHDLMRRDQGLTQLQRLIAHQLVSHGQMKLRSALMSMRVLRDGDHEALSSHLNEVATRLQIPHDLGVVLDLLVKDQWIREASAWLAGDSLPEKVLESLGLGGGTDENREQIAQNTVLALCRLAAETLPIVFCFDQVEALLRSRNDKEAFFRFGRFSADLHDADPNVFLITCVQSAQLATLQEAVLQADFDRFAKRQAILNPLAPAQVNALVLARLTASPGLQNVAPKEAPFHPFPTTFVHSLSSVDPCFPRRILSECARRFEQIQQGEAPRPVTTNTFLTGELDGRFRKSVAELGPGDVRTAVVRGAEVMIGHGRADIVAWDEARDAQEVDVLFADKVSGKRIAVSVRDEADGRSLLPRLTALAGHFPRPDGARLVVVRDPRLPISTRATKAREVLSELGRKGAKIVEPTIEALAALSALSSLLADAKSGDLASDGEVVGEGAVLEWLRGLAKADPARVSAVSEFVDALFAPPPPPMSDQAADTIPADVEQMFLDLLARNRLALVEEVGVTLHTDPKKLLRAARRKPERVLVLEGPPALILDMAGVVAQVEVPR